MASRTSNAIRRKRLKREEAQILRRIGSLLGAQMERRGATQEEIAEQARVARSTLRDTINGVNNPGVLTLRNIVGALGWPSLPQFLAQVEAG